MAGARRGLVLIAEDEVSISELLRLYLVRDGFTVHVETNGASALAAIRELRPDVVLLDVGLPLVDGIEVCRQLRGSDDWTPVIFCTARDDEVDRIVGLELGADDYITKPFSPREVVARIKAVLRRASANRADRRQLVLGSVRVDTESRRCVVAGHDIALTPTQFDLLVRLLERPGRVFGRDELLMDVLGYSSVVGTRTVDVHVAQLRAKLGEACIIRTVRGVGYAADAPRTGE